MSRDSASSTTLLGRNHDIAQSVLSRKRKLCDLYAVATSAEPVPAIRDFGRDLSADDPLALFLDQNDLAKGRYFRDSTLPSRPRRASSLTEIRNDARATSHSTHASRRNSPKSSADSKAGLSATVTGTPERHATKAKVNNDSTDADHKSITSAPDDGQTKSSKLNPDTPNDSSRLRRSKRTGGSLEADRQSTPQLLDKPLVDKASRPESPPYSPDSKSVATTRDTETGPNVSKAQPEVSSIPTPGRDESDDASTSQDQKLLDATTATKDQQDAKSKHDSKGGLHASTDNADTVSSPSPSTAHQSANSPHSDTRSPLTSPEDDEPQSASDQSQSFTILNRNKDSTPVDKTSEQSKPSASDPASSSNNNKVDAKESRKGFTSSDAKSLQPSVVPSTTTSLDGKTKSRSSQDQNASAPVNLSEEKPGKSTALSPQRKLPHQSNEDTDHGTPAQTSPTYSEKARPDIDAPQPKLPRARLSSASAKKKVVKRPQSHRRTIATIGSSRSNPRQRDGFKRSYSKTSRLDYFRLQIVREALNSVYGQDLHSLLSHCNIGLKSSDWMLLNEEELYRIILQRIHHLQNTTRWSMRQPAPADEPKREPTHWDHVLRDAKWLRSDFREERKQKIAVAYQMAKWCSDWVHSTPEQRKWLQVKPDPAIHDHLTFTTTNGDPSPNNLSQPIVGLATEQTSDGIADDTIDVFGSPERALFSGRRASVSRKLLAQIVKHATVGQPFPTGAMKATPRLNRDGQGRNRANSSQDIAALTIKSPRAVELPPKDRSCALFWAESQSTRKRLTAPFVYKPPAHPMPPQGFYEHRPASQWTWEDDQKLRQQVKEYGANWHLIAHNLSPRQEFYSTSDRRTPWECYERFLVLEPPQKELQTQYLKHFNFRIEKAHSSFDEQQMLFRNQAQQHANEVGRPAPNLPQKRFPTPMRVDRKQSKHFLAMLDSARRLAKKRELAASKQEKTQSNTESGTAQKPSQTQPQAPQQGQQGQQQQQQQPQARAPQHTPQQFSRMKAEKEAKEFEKQLHERALLEQQRRQQSNYQASLTNGIGQQMRNGMANNQMAANSHLAVPAHNQMRAKAQQAGMAAGFPNGVSSNAQMAAMASRAQANIPNAQRMTVQINGQNAAATQENMARLMQQAAQRQQQLQSLRAGSSPNMTNAMPNLGMVANFNGSNQFPVGSDGVNNPNIPQNAGSTQSPHVAQALAAAVGSSQAAQNAGQNIPQTLSSGHLPHIYSLQHQIQSFNPNMTEQEARAQATEQLKLYMRRNALNAASGGAGQNQQQAVRGNNSAAQGVSQTSYPNVAQMHVYQQNGLLSSNQQQGRSQSPNSVTPQQQQQQQHYQTQLRQMYNQQQRQQQQQQQAGGDGSVASASPNLGSAIPNNMANMGVSMPQMGYSSGAMGSLNRTPTPGNARPASRAASGVDYGSMQPPEQQQRPGSATGVMSQAFNGPGSSSGGS